MDTLVKMRRCLNATFPLFFILLHTIHGFVSTSLFSPELNHCRSRARCLPGPPIHEGSAVRFRRPPKGMSVTAFTDFDSVRQNLRSVVEVCAASGGSLAVGFLFIQAVTLKRAAPLSLNGVITWFGKLTPEQLQRLSLCLLLDLAGFAPELAFGPIAETADAVWAPVYASLLYSIFGARPFLYKAILATAGFLEEALPFTDAIPSATIGWFLQVPSHPHYLQPFHHHPPTSSLFDLSAAPCASVSTTGCRESPALHVSCSR